MHITLDQARAHAQQRRELTTNVKKLLVERLSLDITPDLIGDDQPLFGRGLELDSIDTLEVAMAIEDEFEVVVTDDDTSTLLSINRLVDHIEAHQ